MSGYKGPRFDLDHLATFTVTSKHGLLHPEDGLRKLKMMDQTTGIWTMRCTLVISPQCVYIIDKLTGNMMEEFPMNLLVDPMAVSTSASDTYSNILLFTVLEDPKNVASQTEMHIFQCTDCPADQIADELKKQKNSNKSPYYVRKENGHYEPNYVRETNSTTLAQNQNDSGRLVAQQRQNGNNDISDEKINRDVNILNHCFDDIEKFIGRLQLVAGARKELERRKKGRGKKKKHHGDGLLVMRARPPPKEEFIDVFKKFKLSFNLLARLRPFIHEPNSSELVHFLITPLSLVVGASKDPVNEMPDLVQRIVSPLLTYEGKELLQNCLSSKEFTFWMSLGEAWTLSREQWNASVPPYYPKFTDGWEPYSPGSEEEKEERPRTEPPPMSYTSVQRTEAAPQRQEYRFDQASTRPTSSRPKTPEQARSHAYSGHFLLELQNSGAKIYQATHDRVGRNNKELTVAKGDYLEILDDARNWWKTRNEHGEIGYVPFTILKLVPQDH